MKIRTWKVGIAALALGASPALAETNGWSYDNNVSGVAFASDCCEPQCGCEDACCADACCDMGCGDSCGGGGLCSDGLLGACGIEGMSLAGLIGADGTGLDVGGWTEGVHAQSGRPRHAVRDRPAGAPRS